MKEENYTSQYKGIIMLRKGKSNDEEVWFATVGNQLVSDGTFATKEELIESLEKLNLDTVCKLILGAFGRVMELTSTKNEEK